MSGEAAALRVLVSNMKARMEMISRSHRERDPSVLTQVMEKQRERGGQGKEYKKSEKVRKVMRIGRIGRIGLVSTRAASLSRFGESVQKVKRPSYRGVGKCRKLG